MRKLALAALAGVVLSLAACAPTDDAGDPLPSATTHEGDSAYYPNVGTLPHSAAPHHKGHTKPLRVCSSAKK
jgi:ABC-type oligopeptide transport system substrate-binding subunit